MENTRLLTVGEAVIILRVSRPTVWRLIKVGTIPSIKLEKLENWVGGS